MLRGSGVCQSCKYVRRGRTAFRRRQTSATVGKVTCGSACKQAREDSVQGERCATVPPLSTWSVVVNGQCEVQNPVKVHPGMAQRRRGVGPMVWWLLLREGGADGRVASALGTRWHVHTFSKHTSLLGSPSTLFPAVL